METMGESVTALAIREGSVEEVMFFRPGSIFRWQQEQSYDKEGASCPLQRQLLLPASPCSSGHVLCALKNTHTGLSLARTARACSAYFAHLCSLHRCVSLESTGPPRPLRQLGTFQSIGAL